ncbi:MAG: peptidylprolyl isomerase [Myxococcales bacterium]|nr:peptidylprolyl isomerase [Myxococcales bacterium]MCB9705662.1 peptidylprolyl isomerase [Myxococcales bacterium]
MRRIASLVVTALCLSACVEPPKPQQADPKDLEKIQPADGAKAGKESGDVPDPVATINDKAITAADFRAIYDLKVKKYSDRGREIPASADRRYRKSITDRLIYQEVLRQEAAARGAEYDKAALAEREEQQRRGIKDWEKHLQRRGETEQSLRDMYIAELQELKLLEIDGKLTVTDQEVDEEYEKVKPNYHSDKERVHAAHILVPIGPQPANPHEPQAEPSESDKAKWKEEAMAKAEEIYKLASAPDADFAVLAKEHSIGPSADKGGDLGIFTKDRMVEEFSAAAFKLKPGEVSKPVETKFGIHIIKCLGKYPAGDLPKDALAEQLRERLRQRKLHQGRRELKEALLEKYKIDNKMEASLGPDPRARARRPRPDKAGDEKGPVAPAGDAKSPPGPSADKPGTPEGGPEDEAEPAE